MIRRAGEGRYANVEREQRWIASGVPPDAQRWAEIVDRYIRGTPLRLRHTESDEQTVFKLGQKVRLVANDPETVKLTNIYLSYEEFALLASLPAAELCKTRWQVAWEGRRWPSTSSMGASTDWFSQRWSSLPATAGWLVRRSPSGRHQR